MNAFQACGSFLGMICGAVVAAMLAKRYGPVAWLGGALGGGFVGILVGALLGQTGLIVYAFVSAAGKIYWELLTGQRKLPSNSTAAERRWVFMIIGVAFAAAVIIMTGVYFFGSEAQRSRLFGAAAGVVGTCVVGVLVLIAHHRRHPPQKAQDEQE